MQEREFPCSEALLERALQTIPLGAQTFSKSVTHLPRGAAPFFLESGKGCRVTDVDGHEYIDFVNALAAITLGYCDPDVDAAVRGQLERGVSFSLSHRLEVELAERLVDAIPCAEQVRFGKNGSDATAAAVRLARAATGRDRVVVCGYHGWQDWYIGSTSRSRGVPEATQQLTDRFEFNDLASLDTALARAGDDVAAVILEPMAEHWPAEGFLSGVQERTRAAGALLIFDETVTGFRFAVGGAQKFFCVTPDLATFGKGMANGFPLAAVVGPRSLMREFDEIFFSTTFGGETLSLAAAIATFDKFASEPVIETLARRGEQLMKPFGDLLAQSRADEFLTTGGHPAWSFLHFRDASGCDAWSIKTLFLERCYASGLLTLGSHNMSYAHGEADVEAALAAYAEWLPALAETVRQGPEHLAAAMHGEALKPLFTVRGGAK